MQQYPGGVNPQIAEQVEKDKKKEKAKTNKGCLNGLGDLKGDPDRQRFVVKVYTIVFCQLMLTTVVTAGVYNSEDAKQWFKDNYWVTYVCMFIGFGVSCALICCQKNARKVPRNYILLFIFTVCWTIMVAGITQWYDAEDVLTAAGLTTAMTLGLTVFACFCRIPLTILYGVVMAGTFALLPLILFAFIFRDRLLYQILCYFVIILTSIYIIFDTRLILDKKGLPLDDYVIAALMLYTDII